jgi:outer membrane protein insertion porin family
MQAARFKRAPFIVMVLLLAPWCSLRAQNPPQQQPPPQPQTPPQQTPQGPPQTVIEIVVPEDLGPPKEVIQRSLRTKVGQQLSQKDINDDVAMLWKEFGILSKVLTEPVPGGGVRLTIEGTRRLEVNTFKFVGNDEKNEKTLKEQIGTTPAQVRSLEDLLRAARRLEDAYKEDGYAFATVEKPDVITTEAGKTAVFTIREGPHVAVDNIEFIGLTTFSERNMRSLMSTSRTFLFFKAYFRRSVLDKDLAVLESFLRDEGYRDASVGLEDLRFKSGGSWVDIVIRIVQGERYTVNSVDLSGNEVFTKEELMRLIKLKPGDPYRNTIVRGDLRRLKSYYGERGYIRFEPLNPEEVFTEQGAQVKVTYRIKEGPRKRVRDVIIRGATDTRDDVVRRVFWLYPGDWFNTKEIEYGANRLRGMGFFTDPKGGDRVKVHTEKTEDADYEDLYIDVEEGRSGLITFQVGTSTGRGVFAGINITKPNFDISRLPSSLWALPSEFFDRKAFHGGGQTLEANLLPGTRDTNYDVHFEEPYLFGPQELPWALGITLYKRDSEYRNYNQSTFGGIITLGKTLARDLSASVGLRSDQIKISELSDTLESGDPLNPTDFEQYEGKNSLRSLRFRMLYDRRDNFRNPTDGWRALGLYEYAGSFLGGELDFTKFTIGAERYLPIYENEKGEKHVIFSGLRFGAADSYGDTDQVPFFERFYGGSSTMDFLAGNFQLRGFDFRGVGPHYGSEPLGGTAAAAATVEYIFPIASYFDAPSGEEITFLKGVFFVDSGTIASDFQSEDWHKWRLSVGAGIRLRIPLPILNDVPLRIDYGIPLLIEKEDERHSFSINLSTRF